MSAIPPIIPKDCGSLAPDAPVADIEGFQRLVERHLGLVYSAAYRRTRSALHSDEVARAVFLVLARRNWRLGQKTVLAGWLYRITALACDQLPRKFRPRRRRWFRFGRRESFPPETDLWARMAPELDAAMDRLSSKQRNAVLLHVFLNHGPALSAQALQTSEQRAVKRAASGLKKLSKLLRGRGIDTDIELLTRTLGTEACAATVPEGLIFEIVRSAEGRLGKRPSLKLARRTLNSLAWVRWRRRLVIGVPTFIVGFILLMATVWHVDGRTGHSRFLTAFLLWSVRHEARTVPGLAQPARPWPTNNLRPQLNAARIRKADDFYRDTNIWLAHLKFSQDQWKALQPRRIGPLPNFFQPDGTVLLRNPGAQRSGLAGVLGFDFHWTHAEFEIGGRTFTNVAARFKGNGTYLSSLAVSKQSFKVDLNKFAKGQKLSVLDEFNFHNLIDDRSYLSDTLAYEFFRDAGVPASRTTFAYLTVSVDGKWQRKPLGLYALVEPVNEAFVAEHFDSKATPLFKPVTYQLFEHLGDDWKAYAAIYDLKTRATPEELRRVIEFARLVSFADDTEFAARLVEFLDLDEFARFLAGEVLLSSYDSIFANGQNFYVYLDPRSNKFGFIPWDLDLAWGGFFLLGSTGQRERASIWHPWVGQHRFLERVMAVEEFRQIYRNCLEDLSRRLLVPQRLNHRIDELAAIIREPIAAESDFRLGKFDQAVDDKKPERTKAGNPQGANRPVHQLKQFIRNRAISVREQLDGKSKGVILERPPRR